MQGALDKNNVLVPIHKAKNKLHLWAPPPLVGDATLEELLKVCHKRTDTFHVVLIPRLLAPQWHRLFNKACDFTFFVSPIVSFWSPEMYEPLWVGIILLFSSHRPWCFERAPLLVEMAKDWHEVLSTGEGDGGDILRKLLKLPQTVACLSERMACGMLHVPGRLSDVPIGGNRGRAGKPVAQRGGKAEEAESRD